MIFLKLLGKNWKNDMEVWEFSLREDQNKIMYVRNSTGTVEL